MTLDATSLAHTAQALDDEPLARIMFGQRELFHTNLLAWFFDALPDAADRVFGDLTTPAPTSNPRSAAREEEKIDLVLRWPDRVTLAIENKVFSLPDMSQLDRYSAVLDRRDGARASRLLLSASGAAVDAAPDDETLPILANGWMVMTYRELAGRIDAALEGATASYAVETMRHYATVARLIDSLIGATAVESDDEPAWLPEQSLAPISSPQVRQALLKVRAHRVADRIRAETSNHWAGAALSHGKPLVEWRKDVERGGHNVEVGWQYQEGDLRRYVMLPHLHGRGAEAKARRTEWAAAHPELFDFALFSSVIGNDAVAHPFRGGSRYGHFDPDFIYQRVRRNDLTVRDLVAITQTLDQSLS